MWRSLDAIHVGTPITELMQGGATGVDTFAREWAATKPGILRYVCRADWDQYGRAAGPIRNKRMLEWGPKMVISFPGGAGTADMVRQATEAGVMVLSYQPGSASVTVDRDLDKAGDEQDRHRD